MSHDGSETDGLLRRVQDGDEAALEELLVRHRARLRRVIDLRMDPRLAARLDPSDVLQEALADAARRLPDYAHRPPCPLYPWLRRITLDRLVDLHRRHVQAQRRSVAREERWGMQLPEGSTVLLAERLAASGTSVAGRLVRQELHERVRGALGQLSSQEREVVIMRHLEQLPLTEVGQALGISAEAARSRYRRAVERLHNLLADGSEDS